ncbi:hypothetical protein CDD81_7951 [Ophiocordyceps australis]|uniref:Swiss Army Knife protein DSP-PTPase phosphatase domain-containing protein n=1 Tax=Ophiocordyceps australis TaxID=1399860 RepID=A0A2C5XZB5_9HYPO|nr:hypothetical protein CDD81_7951 [Ophiocordyceps australis]
MIIKKLALGLFQATATVYAIQEETDKNDLLQLASRAAQAGLHRFEYITEHFNPGDKLARSSAPNYDDTVQKDETQEVRPETIGFLQEQGITQIISLNEQAEDARVREPIEKASIKYLPMPAKDFTPPGREQMRQAWDTFSQNRASTLVCCGYGHGRTGTLVSALQIYAESEKSAPQRLTRADYDKNHVERDEQRQVLEDLQNELGIRSGRPLEPDADEADGPAKKKPKGSAETQFKAANELYSELEALLGLESLPEQAVADAQEAAEVGSFMAEFGIVPVAPEVALSGQSTAAVLSADEVAMLDSLDEFLAGHATEEQITVEQVIKELNEIMDDFPPFEVGEAAGAAASAVGDADIIALLDALPAIAEGDPALVALTAELEQAAAAFGDVDLLSLLPSVPEAEVGTGLALGVEAVEGATVLEETFALMAAL